MTGTRTTLAALAAASLVAPLAAQGTCDLETRKPYQLASAQLYVSKHDQSANAGDRAKLIQQGIRVLTDNPDRIKNEAGRNFMLGGLYIRWFQDAAPRVAMYAKRGDVGFAENPDGEFYLPAALDEAMSVVDRERPACGDSTARYRNSVFGKVLNASIAYYNAKSYDSAIVYANHALRVNSRSPQVGAAYQVLANSSQAKGDLTGAIASLEQSIARMGTDAASAPARAPAIFNLAILTRDQAMKQSGDVRSAGLRKAAQLFKAYVDLAPDGGNAATARAAYARSLQDAGDSVAVAGIYADMIANPGKYTAIQLFEAGVVSANGKKFEDAAKLYEAGLGMNPWYRDALFNLANVYFALRLPEKMAPVVERLRRADPMNPDVLKLAGAVWQERGRQAADPGLKKMTQDSVIAYVEKASKLPARVTVNQFSVGRGNQVTLSGVVENLGAAPASFIATFELLDKSGAVVGAVEAKASAVAPKGSHEFTEQANVAGVVAWRYSMK